MRSTGRRVLGFVWVLLMSMVGLATSQTFINKSGKTATGVTITFSRKVAITLHDSVFPYQSPSELAKRFKSDEAALVSLRSAANLFGSHSPCLKGTRPLHHSATLRRVCLLEKQMLGI